MNQVSLVEQLKEVVKAQNLSLRHKDGEVKTLQAKNTQLLARVKGLEVENDGLKAQLDKHRETNHRISARNEESGKTLIRPSSLNVSEPSADSPGGELYKTALTSPASPSQTSSLNLDAKHQITITLSSTPDPASSKAFSYIRHASPKKTLTRSESRKAKRKSIYELSPDISDKHVQVLENCYGGKIKANHAARVIQQHYRSWAMKKAYFRLRTQSEVRRTSFKGRRSKQGSVRSPTSSEELSPISTIPVPLNFSLDGSDQSISVVDNSTDSPASSWTKPSESATVLPWPAAKDEFKAIKTDLNIDENFQPLGGIHNTSQRGLSIRHMSEDISSIEISKNLLNNSIGKQIIFDEVFQQILSPRKNSISLAGRKDSFRSQKGGKADVPVVGSTPRLESVSVVELVKKDEVEEKIQPAIDEVVCEEKPEDQGVLDSNQNVSTQELNRRPQDTSEMFDVIDGHNSYSWPTLDQLHGDDSTSMGSNSLSPSSSIIQNFYEDKDKDYRIGINYFNRKPKKGISYLIETGVLEEDPESISKFLREEPGISKQKIGEYLGDLRNPLSMEVLLSFVRAVDIEGKQIDEALRFFQTSFRMPGEAQKIERLVEEFSAAYVESNPGMVSDDPDTILVLSFAIIMLNTDLHSPNVKRKMSKQEFIRNLRGTDNGEDLPSEVLSDIYDRVLKKQFKTGPDNLDAVIKYEKQIIGKLPWTTLALPHRQLRQVTSLYEIQSGRRKEKFHHRVVFLFNDMIVVTKERGQAGIKGVHFYSYKSSHPLCDIKFSLFNNTYYKYGIRLLNKSNSQALISFHAKNEDIRKAFYTELRDCIEETGIMESERINSEKTRQLSVLGYGKRELKDSISLTLPRSKTQKNKPAPDSLSLMSEPTVQCESELTGNKLLSSSLQDLTQTDGAYYEETLQKSSSVTSIDDYIGSEFTDSLPPLALSTSLQHLPKKFGLLSSMKRSVSQRKSTKSTGSLEDLKLVQKSVTTQNGGQRKSEFFVKSPIAT